MTVHQISNPPSFAEINLRGLTFSHDAEIISPGDASYEAARSVWNGRIDKHPALIIRCATVEDVVSAVRLGRERQMPVAVRGGGHSVAGFGTCDGGLVIDLARMRDVQVEAATRRARSGGGATWGEFDRATAEAGLATTGGMVTTVGVGGLTLGGGMGSLMRKYGLAADNLVAAQVVTADGTVLNANAEQHPDLLWALRGGGGNFGVVASFEFRLHPLKMVLGGIILHPAQRAAELLRFYRDYVETVPDDLTTLFVFMTAPPAPFVPQPLQGKPAVAIMACYAGVPEQGAEVVRPLREFGPPAVDILQPMPYPAQQSLFDAAAPSGMQTYWKAAYMQELPDAAIQLLAEQAAGMASPLSAVHIHHMQGAVSRVGEHDTAFAHRASKFALNIIPMWMSPAESPQHIKWADGLWQRMQPFATRGVYSNFLGDEGRESVRDAYGDNYARLAALKKKYDPDNFFRMNQNIEPQVA